MKRTFFVFILLIVPIISLKAQDTIDKNEMVGFGCYFAGQPSKTVKKFTNKLKNEKYNSIRRMLYSSNNAEKYLAVISLVELEHKGMKLTDKEINTIKEIKNSSDLVSICSGCTMFMNVELKEMFEPRMKLFSQNWIDQNFK